jgi:hypothetical protein
MLLNTTLLSFHEIKNLKDLDRKKDKMKNNLIFHAQFKPGAKNKLDLCRNVYAEIALHFCN